MNYAIYNGDVLIATFRFQGDRDDCLEILKAKYTGCVFTTEVF